MNSENENGQDSGQPVSPNAPPPKWLKVFLAVNLVALLALFVWEIGPSSFKTDEEIEQIKASHADTINAVVKKNPKPADQTGMLGEVIEYVIDASEPDAWVHLDFSRRAVFSNKDVDRKSAEWDMAFRRAKIVTNGGATRKEGKAGVITVPGDDFYGITTAPLDGYVADLASDNPYETKNPALEKWYSYDIWTHKLKPKNETYIIRTTDKHYAKVRIISYYCDRVAACYTLKYRYQGKDSLSFLE